MSRIKQPWTKNWHNNCKDFAERCRQDREYFLASLKQPMQVQEAVLNDIVEQVAPTKFGEHHNFAKINTISDFQNQVPLRDYVQFEPWLNQEVEAKGGVLTSSPIVRWLKTSGSTGNSKKIPYTVHWMEKYRTPALGILWANYLQSAPTMLMQPYATMDTQTTREDPDEFLNGIPYQGITNRNYMITDKDWLTPWYEAPWFTADVPTGYDARMYYRLRYFLGQDLRAILTINPSTLIAMRHHLQANLPQLITEVAAGTVNGKQVFDPDPEMAQLLTELQDKEDFNLKEIWPNLDLISCWTSASARFYLPELEKIFPGTKLLPFMTCGTEGIVTLPVDEHLVSGPLAVTQGFYEFLPAGEDLDAIIKSGIGVKALLFNELKLGEEYHLIMTQASGMCRYAVGDIFKVIGFYNGVPRLEFSRRHGTYFSFTGEKITETQMLMVMETVMDKYNLTGSLFMCCPVWGQPPFYKIMVEVNKEFDRQALVDIAADIDQLLCLNNEEYESKRKSNRLGSIQLFAVVKGAIDNFIEEEKVKSNATQFKYKPLQKNDALFEQVLQRGAL